MNAPVQRQIENLLKAGDIARILSISKTAAYKMMREDLPVVSFGPGTKRVRESDLAKYIADHVDFHS